MPVAAYGNANDTGVQRGYPLLYRAGSKLLIVAPSKGPALTVYEIHAPQTKTLRIETPFIYDSIPLFVYFAYKFTGKEHDTESGLDYFGARYYGSSMGRFMSPDSGADISLGVPVPFAELENPQSLNLYSYVRNNPLSITDSDGQNVRVCVVGASSFAVLKIRPPTDGKNPTS